MRKLSATMLTARSSAALAWPVMGVLILSLEAAIRALLHEPLTAQAFLWSCIWWLETALFAPVIVMLAERFPYRRGERRAFALVHGAAPFILSFLHSALSFGLRIAVTGRPGPEHETLREIWASRLPTHVTFDVLLYGSTVLAVHVVLFLRDAYEREQERLALERSIAGTELDVLKLQLPPQLIDGQLHEIEEAIELDPMDAESRIMRLSAFLRERLPERREPLLVREEAPHFNPGSELPRPMSLPLLLLIVLGIVPAVLLLVHVFMVVRALVQGQPIPWDVVVAGIAASWLSWPITVLMLWLGARVRRMLPLAVVAAVAPPLWDLAFHGLTASWAETRTYLLSSSNRTIDFLVFFGVALGALAHARYVALRRDAVEVAQLDAVLLRTRARMLRLQLHPHFIFNALNSIAALLEDDRDGARRMCARLRHFVTRVLETSDRQEVSLAEELDLLTTYVAIENVRFGNRVQLDVQVQDAASGALVPGFLLQPLVENALRHGLQPSNGGRVAVSAARDGRGLRLEVLDNGRPRGTATPIREGIGLSNTRSRLRQLYGDDYTLLIERGGAGFRAVLTIPYRAA
jgi:two-component system LytT family sensor kinase